MNIQSVIVMLVLGITAALAVADTLRRRTASKCGGSCGNCGDCNRCGDNTKR